MLLTSPPHIVSAAINCTLGNSKRKVVEALHNQQASPTVLSLPDYPNREFRYFKLDDQAINSHFDLTLSLYDEVASCVSEALANSGLSEREQHKTALFVGSSSFDVAGAEQRYHRFFNNRDNAIPFKNEMYGDIAYQLADQFELKGGNYTFCTACTSSANALIYAAQMISNGDLDAAVVVGVERFNRTTLLGFESLQLLEPNTYRPFDIRRNGMILGEALSAIVLTSAKQHPVAAEWQNIILTAVANSCDRNGMTCSSSTAMAAVMQEALDVSPFESSNIDLIKSHGTGSISNDEAEANAMSLLFSEQLPAITAMKGSLGHTLGASGVLELVALVSCLKSGFIPASQGFSESDPDLPCSPITQEAPFNKGNIMLNHFGFGGNNTSLIVSIG
jgi:3-oxoacyl-[acyl-carrier-protein] synthase-1